MSNTRITRRTALSLTMAAASGTLIGNVVAQAGRTVKIGTVIPLSGPFASIGQNIKAGAEMAIEDINAAGGIKSLGGAKLELVAADAEESVEKAKKRCAAAAGAGTHPGWRFRRRAQWHDTGGDGDD